MRPLLIVSQVICNMRPAYEAIEAEVLLKLWDVLHSTLKDGCWRLMDLVRQASATSEAIDAEVLLKV